MYSTPSCCCAPLGIQADQDERGYFLNPYGSTSTKAIVLTTYLLFRPMPHDAMGLCYYFDVNHSLKGHDLGPVAPSRNLITTHKYKYQ